MSTSKKTAAPKPPKEKKAKEAGKPIKIIGVPYQKIALDDPLKQVVITPKVIESITHKSELEKEVVSEMTEALFCKTFTEMLLHEAKIRMVRRERANISPEDLEEIAKVITPKIVAIFKN